MSGNKKASGDFRCNRQDVTIPESLDNLDKKTGS